MPSLLSRFAVLGTLLLLLGTSLPAQETHDHPAPEKLGAVTFPTTCNTAVQKEFERGVALLHSFAYAVARSSFEDVAARDPQCAMAHWGVAMTYFRQLWDPPITPDGFTPGQTEIRRAQAAGAGSERERRFIDALAPIYDPGVPYRTRISNYEASMGRLAAAYPNDGEAQVFYALALLATASPADRTHTRQKQAAAILEPLVHDHPDHPGIAHYLIHAFDNAELAPRGEAVARAYSKIAPSAPHALHMPSHIFTRLGMWSDSIASNRAARAAAHRQGDTGEELHAMDYLVYAYLQEGRDGEAKEVIGQLARMGNLDPRDFKIAYAATAMRARYAVERRQWTEAASLPDPEGAPPHVLAIAAWTRALGLARSGHAAGVQREIATLNRLEQQLRASGNDYWATQVGIQAREAAAWLAQAQGKASEARELLRKVADEEDAIEKLPVTPGPIVPAREQLGDLLLEQNEPKLAIAAFQQALVNAPKRRGALEGLKRAGDDSSQSRGGR